MRATMGKRQPEIYALPSPFSSLREKSALMQSLWNMLVTITWYLGKMESSLTLFDSDTQLLA